MYVLRTGVGWRAKRGQQSKGMNVPSITIKLHLAITAKGHVVEGFNVYGFYCAGYD